MPDSEIDLEGVERLNFMNDILKAASSSIHLGTSFQRMCNEVKTILPHDRAALTFVLPGSEFAVFFAVSGKEAHSGVGDVIPLVGTSVGKALEIAEPLIRTEIETGEDFPMREELLSMGIHSNLTVPLKLNDHVVGILSFGSTNTAQYGEAEGRLAQWISEQVSGTIMNGRAIHDILNLNSGVQHPVPLPAESVSRFTRREKQVLQLLALGNRNHEIAASLVINQRTVRFHIENIYRKLGVHNRTQAIRMVFLDQLLDF